MNKVFLCVLVSLLTLGSAFAKEFDGNNHLYARADCNKIDRGEYLSHHADYSFKVTNTLDQAANVEVTWSLCNDIGYCRNESRSAVLDTGDNLAYDGRHLELLCEYQPHEVGNYHTLTASITVRGDITFSESDSCQFAVERKHIRLDEGSCPESVGGDDTGQPYGRKGPMGHTGPSGPTGARGYTGPEGPPGPPGRTGFRGLPGSRFPFEPDTRPDNCTCRGIRGPPGRPGERGPTGYAGERGVTGQPGPAGPRGLPGYPGSPDSDPEDPLAAGRGPRTPGPTGPPGPRGPPGRNGWPGDPGPRGPTGARGPPGRDGRDVDDNEAIAALAARIEQMETDVALARQRLDQCPQCGGDEPPPESNPKANPIRELFRCDFDDSSNPICNMVQSKDDNYDWTRRKGSTPSVGTGPKNDYPSGNGSYLYAEASDPQREGHKAIIDTPLLQGPVCLKFAYHMRGSKMGSLSVYQRGDNGIGTTPKFEKSGNQGQDWRQAAVYFDAPGFKISFQATRGSSYTSDVAIDDIRVVSGSCD